MILALLTLFVLRHEAPSGPGPAQTLVEPTPEITTAESEVESLDVPSEVFARSDLSIATTWSAGEGPVQLSGRVVDERGRPLVGANILVAELEAAKPGVVTCLTDADGRFEARGSWNSDNVLVRAAHPDCWNAARRTTQHGSTNLELALEHGAQLRGRFATDDLQPLPDLSFSLVNLETKARTFAQLPLLTEPEQADRPGSAVRCTPDGEFICSGLRPGRYSLDVRGAAHGELMATVSEIELHIGERWRGPECDPLLLRIPPSGEVEIELVLAEFRGLGEQERLRVYLDALDAVGRSKERFSTYSHGNKVIEEPGSRGMPSVALVPGEPTRMRVFGPGRYEVLVFLERPGEQGAGVVQFPVESDQSQYVEVPSGVSLPQIRIELDPIQRATLLGLTAR